MIEAEKQTIFDYPHVDLSILHQPEKLLAVRCSTEYESQCFLATMMAYYPQKCRAWSFPHTNWISYTGHLDFFPYLNNHGGKNLMYATTDWAERNKYEIISFSELGCIVDIGEFECGEVSIDELLGV